MRRIGIGLAALAAAAAVITITLSGGDAGHAHARHAHPSRTVDVMGQVLAGGTIDGSLGDAPSTPVPSLTAEDRREMALTDCRAAFSWGSLLPGCRLADGQAWLDGASAAFGPVPGSAIEGWINPPPGFHPSTLAGVDLGDLDRLGRYKAAVCRAAERQAELPVGCTTRWQGRRVTAVREGDDGFIPAPNWPRK